MKKDLKKIVQDKYAALVTQEKESCCGPSSCCGPTDADDITFFSEDYSQLEGYVEDADLELGCGIPVNHIEIKPGMSVLDLGAGAGNDVFVAARMTGPTGNVVGIDFTPAMVEKARANKAKLGLEYVSFVQGDIEDMPLADNSFDLVISNCVLNLVPNKKKAFSEIKRVLKTGGRFSISDIVLQGELSPALRDAAALYAGCVSGALQKDTYLDIVRTAGFQALDVAKERKIELPDALLARHVSADEIKDFRDSGTGIYSITLLAQA